MHLPDGHSTVHVAPVLQVVVQLPPVHDTLHVAPVSQVVLQLPVRHESVHLLPVPHVVSQPLAAVFGHSSEQSPPVGQSHVVPLHRPGPPDDVVPPSPPSGVPLPTVQSYVHAIARRPHTTDAIATRDTLPTIDKKRRAPPRTVAEALGASPGEEEESLGPASLSV